MIIKQLLRLLMWYPFRAMAKCMPLTVLGAFAVAGSRILYAISGTKRAVMREEFARVLPDSNEAQLDSIVRDSFALYTKSEAEVLLYPHMDRTLMEKMVTIEGREHLDAALAKGKGVLLFQAHFGAFQMVMPAIGYCGYKMNQISAMASTWKDSASDVEKRTFDMKSECEKRLPVQHIPVDASMRPVFRALERNEIVGITVDGGGGTKITQIDYLDRIANFQRGGADLALRTGAEIVPALITTGKGLHHKLTILPPIETLRTDDNDSDIRNVLQQFALILERYVRENPSHYGYTLCLRRMRARTDSFPFFTDYE